MKSYALALVIALSGLSSTSFGLEIKKPFCMKQFMNSLRINDAKGNFYKQAGTASPRYTGSAPAAVNRRR